MWTKWNASAHNGRSTRYAWPVPCRKSPRASHPWQKEFWKYWERRGRQETTANFLTTARADLGALKKMSVAGLVELTRQKPNALCPGEPSGEADSPLVLTPAQPSVLDDLTTQLESGKIPHRAAARGDGQRKDGSLSSVDCALPRDGPHRADAGAGNCPDPVRAGSVPGPVWLTSGVAA